MTKVVFVLFKGGEEYQTIILIVNNNNYNYNYICKYNNIKAAPGEVDVEQGK